MGKDFNEGTMIGRATRDPEMRYTPGGVAVTNLDLAVGDDYFDKSSNAWVERTNFFRFTAFSGTGERVAEKIGKGDKVLVKYSMRNSNYERDGKTVYQNSMLIYSYQMLDKRKENASSPRVEVRPPEPALGDDVPF